MRSSAALLDRSGCVSGEERPTNARLARQLSRYPIDERNLVSEATEIVRDTRADKSQRHTRVIAYALKSPLKSNSWRKSRAKRPNLPPKPNISPPDPLACRYLTFRKPLAPRKLSCAKPDRHSAPIRASHRPVLTIYRCWTTHKCVPSPSSRPQPILFTPRHRGDGPRSLRDEKSTSRERSAILTRVDAPNLPIYSPDAEGFITKVETRDE